MQRIKDLTELHDLHVLYIYIYIHITYIYNIYIWFLYISSEWLLIFLCI